MASLPRMRFRRPIDSTSQPLWRVPSSVKSLKWSNRKQAMSCHDTKSKKERKTFFDRSRLFQRAFTLCTKQRARTTGDCSKAFRCFACDNIHLWKRKAPRSHRLHPTRTLKYGQKMDSEPESMAAFLGSVEGELAFFRSLMRSRPVGMNRHFHVLSMRNAIHKDTGHWVDIEAIWEKLKGHYDLEALDAIVR